MGSGMADFPMHGLQAHVMMRTVLLTRASTAFVCPPQQVIRCQGLWPLQTNRNASDQFNDVSGMLPMCIPHGNDCFDQMMDML